ncbi:MAG: nuclear transport factor 2 family protein [Hamadaea sp.]|uniref:nuclear transport factor 2 family protein n=1 Tax=Hamadaea sp. TaxID=2024425 RepID=UPI0017C6FEAD|nr:nuclear transport factor 2 family protein [Hamadaea sp.]NUR71393.1 nuclear transport factor 2 family protein [Hamadaea sp.]NUT22690.1 nuclear transport factor 2 family protein [Hamadaea sp.]
MEIIENYLTAWNTTDAAARKELIAATYTEDARYIDPLADVTGHEQIDGLLAAVQGQFPGLEFRLGGPVDAHHDIARFTWHLVPAGEGGEPIVIGFDVVELADGRIAKVHGFLDKVPGGAA